LAAMSSFCAANTGRSKWRHSASAACSVGQRIGLFGLFILGLIAPNVVLAVTPRDTRCDVARSRQLIIDAAHQRISEPADVERAIRCAGRRVKPTVAAAAAYELAVMYAQQRDGSVEAFRRAAGWARHSAAFLRAKEDRELRTKMVLEALRLDFYAAASPSALRNVRSGVDTFIRSCTLPPQRRRPCDDALKLLGEVSREEAGQGQAHAGVRAISAFRRYLASPAGREPGEDRASALLDLGTLLAQQGERLVATEVIEALGALRQAVSLLSGLSRVDRLALAQVNLGALLVDHAPHAATIDEAEILLRPWADPANQAASAALRVAAQRNLAGALFRKQTGNREQHLDDAVTLFRQSLAGAPARDVVTRIRSAIGLAIALEASSRREAQRLGEATLLLDGALQLAKGPAFARERSKALSVLIDVKLHQRRIGEDQDPAEIERLLVEAHAAASPDVRDQARMAALAADVVRFLGTRASSNRLDATIRGLRAALTRLGRDRDPALWATLQNNLGNLCNDRRRPELAPCAEEAYGLALSVRTAEAMPREHIDTTINLANLSFGQRDWNRAARLYEQVAAASRVGFDPSLDRDILLYDAARSDRWFERGAFALAQLGQSTAALEIADAGRARWLRQRLGQPQTRPGPVLETLRAALPERAVILMPIVTTAGTVVLAVARRGASVTTMHLTLTGLDGDAVAAFLKNAWLEPYATTFPDQGMEPIAPMAWNRSVLAAGIWAGTHLFEPVLHWLKQEGLWPANELMLSVQGELALLPLHAATLSDGSRVLEHTRVSFVPGAGLLEPRPSAFGQRKLLTLHDPAQEQSLPYSVAEAMLAVRAGGEAPEGRLDLAQVLKAFDRAEILHFVGHARFDPEEPQASSLRLADGQRIHVREISDHRPARAPDLVILSACETGRVETATMANEYVGLPLAFMSLGAKGVISSLWPASDGPTLFLIARVLFELQTNGKPPADALRDAQIWLSRSTGLELGRMLRVLKPEPGSPVALLAQILSVDYRTKQPYAEPWAWAGFVYVGRQ
jgi:hypothetical protein